MKSLLYIEVTFVDRDFEYDVYEVGDLKEVALLKETMGSEYKFVSTTPVYG